MGGNYEKDVFRQLTELMEKVDSLQKENKEERQEIKVLKANVRSLSHENNILKEQVTSLKSEQAWFVCKNSAAGNSPDGIAHPASGLYPHPDALCCLDVRI